MIMTKKKYKKLQIDKTSNSEKRVLLSEEEISHIMEMKSFLIFLDGGKEGEIWRQLETACKEMNCEVDDILRYMYFA